MCEKNPDFFLLMLLFLRFVVIYLYPKEPYLIILPRVGSGGALAPVPKPQNPKSVRRWL